MKVRYSADAARDVLSAVEYVSARNPKAARVLYEDIRAVIRRIASGELEGPETVLLAGPRVRSWPVRSFRIYYQRTNTVLFVIRIYHHARQPITE